MKIRLWFASITGLTIGISAALAQAFFEVQPPEAIGYCMVCHPATIVKWVTNNYLGTDFSLLQPFVLFPSLLAVGVVIGSFAAANRNGRVVWQHSPTRKRFMAGLFGFLVAIFGLIVAGCPIRIGLLVSYGSVTGVILLAAIISGAGLACLYFRFRKEVVK